nr:ATG8-interacting protein 2-like [Tanacetum cinerariifolium]
MADKEEGQGTTPRGADWEVVSLTASAYAAAPGGTIPEFKHEEKGDAVDKDKVETSNALFMSGHFVVPPNQHENVQSESENAEVSDHQVGKDDGSESVGGKLNTKEEENWAFKKLTETDFAENTALSDDETSVLDESVQSSDPASGPNTPNLPKQTKEDNYGGSGPSYASWLKKQAVCLPTVASRKMASFAS